MILLSHQYNRSLEENCLKLSCPEDYQDNALFPNSTKKEEELI